MCVHTHRYGKNKIRKRDLDVKRYFILISLLYFATMYRGAKRNFADSLATLPANSDRRAKICQGTFQVADATGWGKISALLLESTQLYCPQRKVNTIRKPWCRTSGWETFQRFLKSQTTVAMGKWAVTCHLFRAGIWSKVTGRRLNSFAKQDFI